MKKPLNTLFSFPLAGVSVVSFFETLRPPQSILLHSATDLGRYSFLAFSPTEYFEGVLSFEEMNAHYERNKKEKQEIHTYPFPFAGGLVALVPYETTSIGVFGIYDYWVVEDHLTHETFVCGWFSSSEEATAWASAFQTTVFQEPSFAPVYLSKPFEASKSKIAYLKHFENCQKELKKGNSFQINLSQKFEGTTQDNAWNIFCRATKKNPAPMMAFWENGEKSMISCSPERLISIDTTRKMLTQPIAGTRKRGKTKEEEQLLEQELLSSVKENAEHSMLVDLLRNDFGKVANYGSVQVPAFKRIEKYQSVMHLVSDVEGVLCDKKNYFEAFEAVFPGGTITGAPKKETMEILQREESEPRGFYCGSAVYISYSGSCDSSILIRTLEKTGEHIMGRAGGGLVFGADGEKEYEETQHKFKGLKNIFTEINA